MPGPAPFFRSQAERQRAYRRRLKEVQQQAEREAEETFCYAYVLHAAVRTARGAADPVAEKVYRDDPWETLRAIADHFYDLASTPSEQRP